MIHFEKPVLTEDFYVVQKEEFSIKCYTYDTYIWRKAKHIHKGQTHFLAREDVTYGQLSQGFSLKKKICGRDPQGAWRQDVICDKPPVVK
jgi:hypothetical protein